MFYKLWVDNFLSWSDVELGMESSIGWVERLGWLCTDKSYLEDIGSIVHLLDGTIFILIL